MQFTFTDEQTLLRESARRFLEATACSGKIRAACETPLGYDEKLWRGVSRELGWAATAIPQAYGGTGLGMVELAILQHEQGRRLIPSPFFSTVCLAAPLISTMATESQKERWLGRIAAGEVRIAVALTGPRGGAGAHDVQVELTGRGESRMLRGESDFVICGHACDLLLVVARESLDERGETLRAVLIDPAAEGVSLKHHVMLDLTRRMSYLRLSDVRVAREELLGTEGITAAEMERALDWARVALASEALGGAEYTIEMTTRYVKERVQFGRPVGSFQAVKHRLADMAVLLEAARSAAWYAACVADESPEALAQAAAIAKSACCEAFFQCAGNAIQLHGGIGFSWDHDCHLYFKRARASATLLGSPSWQRERLAIALGLGEPAFKPPY
jgi:alkylation response protein AidB-like acyl-CoA dehydrogenase